MRVSLSIWEASRPLAQSSRCNANRCVSIVEVGSGGWCHPLVEVGATHHNDLPIIVAGGGQHLRTGLHINLPEGAPLANLWLTQARMLGVSLPRFADSTGVIKQIVGETA